MDKETVIRLALEAGLEILNLDGEDEVGCGDGYHIQTDLIERFAALIRDHITWSDIHTCHPGCTKPPCVAMREAVLAEREECARICDDADKLSDWPTAANCAAAIRSRT